MMIDIATEFSPYPSGRDENDGKFNGTKFRQHLLIPAIKSALAGPPDERKIIIDIDGVRAFGSSFLEEAFGGLARESGIDVESAIALFDVKCTQSHLTFFHDAIIQHLEEAKQIANQQA